MQQAQRQWRHGRRWRAEGNGGTGAHNKCNHKDDYLKDVTVHTLLKDTLGEINSNGKGDGGLDGNGNGDGD